MPCSRASNNIARAGCAMRWLIIRFPRNTRAHARRSTYGQYT
jgi:hypothetical protein